MENPDKAALECALPNRVQHHVFLCLGPDCCEPERGQAVWVHIKDRLREAGLPVLRTKAACLRVCQGGPWLLIYPEGVWYGGVDEARFDRILQEHLRSGRPVEEWVAARRCPAGVAGSCDGGAV